MAAPFHSGSRAKTESEVAGGTAAAAAEQEWLEAEALDRREAQKAARAGTRRLLARIVPVAVVAAVVPTVLWWTPGFSPANTEAALIASAVAALVAVSIVPFTNRLAMPLAGSGAGDRLLFLAALASAGAAAIHF